MKGPRHRRADLPEGFTRTTEGGVPAILDPDGLVLRIDFTSPAMRRRTGSSWRKEPLLRAVGRRPGRAPAVLDATGGAGRDAFVLAAHGCRVTLCERNPAVAALLADALDRAAACPATAAAAARITLVAADSVGFMRGLEPETRPDAVYLDPMYPAKRGKALSGQEMRVLRRLCGPSRDDDLIDAALAAATARVAVKRPGNAPPLGGREPDFTIRGPAHRFDVYLRPAR